MHDWEVDSISQRLVGIDLLSIRDGVGHASMGGGAIGLLERTVWKTLQYRSLEDDSTVLNVMHLERMLCLKLRRL
jgi:hypothetical protein